jgi:hypothetical protein
MHKQGYLFLENFTTLIEIRRQAFEDVIISGGPDDPTKQHNDFQSKKLPDRQL